MMARYREKSVVVFVCVAVIVGASVAMYRKPVSTVTGRFRALSFSTEKIVIEEWRGFGNACPPDGSLVPGGDSGTDFGTLSRHPEECEVVWRSGSKRGRQHSQQIILRDIVPVNVAGQLVFEFRANGVWDVKFVREGMPILNEMEEEQFRRVRQAAAN